MNVRHAMYSFAATSFVTLVAATPALAASPFDGTWKIDMAKAHFSEKPDVVSLKDGVYRCISCTPPLTVKADGAFHAVTGQIGLDEMAIKVVDADTVIGSYKFHGKLTGEGTRTVSADGKTMAYHFTDFSQPNGKQVYGGEETRVAAGSSGSHAISGAWTIVEGSAKASDAVLSMTLKLDGKTVSESMPTGTSYVAPLGGPAVPIKGDPIGSMAALKMTGPRTLIETDSVKGKVTSVSTMSLLPDGKTMTIVSYDPIGKTSSKFVATKQ